MEAMSKNWILKNWIRMYTDLKRPLFKETIFFSLKKILSGFQSKECISWCWAPCPELSMQEVWGRAHALWEPCGVSLDNLHVFGLGCGCVCSSPGKVHLCLWSVMSCHIVVVGFPVREHGMVGGTSLAFPGKEPTAEPESCHSRF